MKAMILKKICNLAENQKPLELVSGYPSFTASLKIIMAKLKPTATLEKEVPLF